MPGQKPKPENQKVKTPGLFFVICENLLALPYNLRYGFPFSFPTSQIIIDHSLTNSQLLSNHVLREALRSHGNRL